MPDHRREALRREGSADNSHSHEHVRSFKLAKGKEAARRDYRK